MAAPASFAEPAAIARRLEAYVGIESTNPSLGGPGEAAMADALEADLGAAGLAVERQEVAPGRHNVFGRLGSDTSLPTIVLDAHLDTVPASTTMKKPGWRGETLFGRGSCDDKASLAAMVEAVRQVARRGGPRRANIVLSGTVDEEVTVKGAEAAVKRLADASLIIVGEPTGLDIGTWHKGTTRFTVEAHGRAGHSSMPEQADNAIMHMGIVLQRIAERVIPALGAMRHASGESCKCSVGSIRGGGPLNAVPASCIIGVDVRRIPGVETDVVLALFDEVLGDLAAQGKVSRSAPIVSSRAFATSASAELVGLVSGLARTQGAASREIGLPFGTNANRFAPGGAAILIAGPGDIRHAHADNEQVALSEVVQAANFYIDVLDHAPALLRPRGSA
ncbi:MAG: M20/M25/M40 family metallo-hydrolase [Rhizobiaceae bacterium]|nr:M20/M25/M40 family metallo-hydrolase [Rhizobiaceae bacterium]